MTAPGEANPFLAIHADAWDAPVDVPSLNKDVSDLILSRIDQVRRVESRRGARQGSPPRSGAALRATSVLLLGPAGSGKTHLFTRLRAQAGARAVFVHSRPEVAAEPSPRHVLAAIVGALRQSVSGSEHRQVDVIVGAMLAALEGGEPRYPFTLLDDHLRKPAEARREILARVVERAEDQFPEISPLVLERLLSVPFAGRQDQRALFAWLSGREPSELDLARVGATGALSDLELLPALQTLGVAAAFGAPLVLVFDQLENLAEEGGKIGRILAHARLVSELRDRMHGLVIVQMALDAEWMTRIHPALHASDRDRLEETVKTLSLPTVEERRSLIKLWRDALPEAERGQPFPSPFVAADVDAWTRSPGMTPRMLMQACGEAYLRAGAAGEPLEPTAAAPADPGERLSVYWDRSVARARAAIDEAAEQARGVTAEGILGGLLTALRLLGVEASSGAVKEVPSLEVNRGGHALVVLVAQHAHHSSLGAALKFAAGSAARAPTLLFRERAFAIPPTWKEVTRLLAAFTDADGAVFAPIEREDLTRLLAIEDFLAAARSQDLSADDGRPIPTDAARAWAERQLGCADWAPLKAVFALEAAPPKAAHRSRPAPAAPLPPPVGPSAGAVRAILERLRVTSIDRLTREARAVDPRTTRAAVAEELRRLPVKIFGGSVVALEDPWP